MVYLGGSRALAALEMLVHLTSPLSRAKRYQIIQVEIPAELVATYPLGILPPQWQNHPPDSLTQEIGDDWLQAEGQLALRIPSILIPEEHNLLLNPNHPDFLKIKEHPPKDFSFDSRL
jgi:RES domain-containing protein